MKMIGVDYGEKRVGIAVSDVEGKMAFPKTIIENSSSLAEDIKNLATEVGATQIVIGESKDFKGNDNPVMSKINKLKEALENLGLTVTFEPEFMTSKLAERQGSANNLDASAAALILQSYLDRK